MEGGFGKILLYAMLPVAGHLVGTALAESVRTPKWVVGAALHAAAGIAIAVVAIDLMPRILLKLSIVAIAVFFLAGALASVLLARAVGLQQTSMGRSHHGKAWMVYAAVSADLVSDGTMTGAGTAIGGSLGLILAASQAVANIPGGFAGTANLRNNSIARGARLAVAAGMVVPATISAAFGFWLLSDVSPGVQYAVLASIAGVLLLTTVEDVIPEGDDPKPPRWISSAAFAGGFASMSLLSGGMR